MDAPPPRTAAPRRGSARPDGPARRSGSRRGERVAARPAAGRRRAGPARRRPPGRRRRADPRPPGPPGGRRAHRAAHRRPPGPPRVATGTAGSRRFPGARHRAGRSHRSVPIRRTGSSPGRRTGPRPRRRAAPGSGSRRRGSAGRPLRASPVRCSRGRSNATPADPRESSVVRPRRARYANGSTDAIRPPDDAPSSVGRGSGHRGRRSGDRRAR
jgi:hypothetical protein